MDKDNQEIYTQVKSQESNNKVEQSPKSHESKSQAHEMENKQSPSKSPPSMDKFKVKVISKVSKLKTSKSLMMKVKRRCQSKNSLGQKGSNTSLDSRSSSDEDITKHSYYHVKTEKVMKSAKNKIKVKKRKTSKVGKTSTKSIRKDQQNYAFSIEVTSDTDSPTSSSSYTSLACSQETLYQPLDIEVIEPIDKLQVDMSKFVSKSDDKERSLSSKNCQKDTAVGKKQQLRGQENAATINSSHHQLVPTNVPPTDGNFFSKMVTGFVLFVSFILALASIYLAYM